MEIKIRKSSPTLSKVSSLSHTFQTGITLEVIIKIDKNLNIVSKCTFFCLCPQIIKKVCHVTLEEQNLENIILQTSVFPQLKINQSSSARKRNHISPSFDDNVSTYVSDKYSIGTLHSRGALLQDLPLPSPTLQKEISALIYSNLLLVCLFQFDQFKFWCIMKCLHVKDVTCR